MKMYLGLFFSLSPLPPPLSTMKDDPELTVPWQDPNFSRSLCVITLPGLEMVCSVYKCIQLYWVSKSIVIKHYFSSWSWWCWMTCFPFSLEWLTWAPDKQGAGVLWVKLCHKHYRKEKLLWLSSDYVPRAVLGVFIFRISFNPHDWVGNVG